MSTGVISPLHQVLALWNKWVTQRSVERDEQFRERTIRGSIVVILVGALAIAVLFVLTAQANRLYQPVILMFFSIVAAWAVQRRRLLVAGWALVLLGIVFAVTTELQSGYWLPGTFVAGVLALLLGAMLVPLRSAARIPFILVILYTTAAVWAGSHGAVSPFPSGNIYSSPLLSSLTFAIIIFLLSGTGYYLLRELFVQRAELERLVETLEDRVDARTRDLGVAAQVSQQVTQVLDLEELLPQLTELTHKSFDLYHVSIFIYYEASQLLCLDAGTGDAGQKMLAASKQFHVNDHGLVPLAMRERKVQVINDVTGSPNHKVNPFLPNTRS